MSEKDDDLLEDVDLGPLEHWPRDDAGRRWKPWHRLRKQWVRDHIWHYWATELLRERPIKDRPLRYLTLPGPDFLDVRALHSALPETEIHFLGFDSVGGGTQDQLVEDNIALNEVRSLPRIDQTSSVVRGRIERVAAKTIGATELRKRGPFDIVNLDLCESIAPRTRKDTYFDAVGALFEVQRRAEGQWLLFLTFRAVRDEILPYVRLALDEEVKRNLQVSAAFRSAWSSAICDDEPYWVAHATALYKWLIGLGIKERWKGVMLGAARYDKAPLVTVAIAFLPEEQHATDRAKLINPKKHKRNERRRKKLQCDEPKLAERALEMLLGSPQVEEELAKEDVREETLQAAETLLAEANYNTDSYRGWLIEIGALEAS